MPRQSTPLQRAADAIGDKWALLVVAALLGGPGRFKDLQAMVPGIATNVLTKRLRHLEQFGLVVSRPYTHRPPRMEYVLTERGRELAGALRLLTAWGSSTPKDHPQHQACGTAMEPRWHCPTCDRIVDEGESELTYL
ncbi:MAG: helix-turn-helix transcriptional regulator [Acidimicrobiia bacterium]|nr:helix-turn-helix transcriptional regulator [Acidimicrobiia bacterium]NNC74808.1 helix-turn-helix transcriptional regulator [Acidimicrobiia bacterium]